MAIGGKDEVGKDRRTRFIVKSMTNRELKPKGHDICISEYVAVKSKKPKGVQVVKVFNIQTEGRDVEYTHNMMPRTMFEGQPMEWLDDKLVINNLRPLKLDLLV